MPAVLRYFAKVIVQDALEMLTHDQHAEIYSDNIVVQHLLENGTFRDMVDAHRIKKRTDVFEKIRPKTTEEQMHDLITELRSVTGEFKKLVKADSSLVVHPSMVMLNTQLVTGYASVRHHASYGEIASLDIPGLQFNVHSQPGHSGGAAPSATMPAPQEAAQDAPEGEVQVGNSGGVTPIWSHWQFAPSHAPPGQQQHGYSGGVAPIWSHWQFVPAHAPLGEQRVGHSGGVAPVCPPWQFVPAQAPPMVAPQASMHSSERVKNTHQAPSIDEPPQKKVKQALVASIFHSKDGNCTACERKGYATPEELEVAVNKTRFSQLRDLADRYQTKHMPGGVTFAKWYRCISREHAKPKPEKP
ncbi:hypothetical protein CYMTET_43308 [Cymbomonas tetramitiformis]|uniref:Uncharacterized protein n=1 Tax=Cymbomonas tetramitiformis TaxID=36881 RepID=A0AAE0C4C0_9CHLO|nr:hypothetical protein CYMTET_43308 [Cymbomonas tetramitiformis]